MSLKIHVSVIKTSLMSDQTTLTLPSALTRKTGEGFQIYTSPAFTVTLTVCNHVIVAEM